MMSITEIREDHLIGGLPADLPCEQHSPLYHLVGRDESEWDEVEDERLSFEEDPSIRPDWQERLGIKERGHNVIIDGMDNAELRLEVSRLKTTLKKLTNFVNELVVEHNQLNDKVKELEAKMVQP